MHVSSESHASYSPPSRLGSAFGGNFKGSEHKFSQRLPETSSQRVAIFKPSRWCFFYIASLFEEFFWLFLCCLLKMKKKSTARKYPKMIQKALDSHRRGGNSSSCEHSREFLPKIASNVLRCRLTL